MKLAPMRDTPGYAYICGRLGATMRCAHRGQLAEWFRGFAARCAARVTLGVLP